MIHIEPRHLAIVQKALKKHDYSFFVFGSRAKGTQKRFSDLDLLYFDAIPSNALSQIQEAFEESELPFTVDLVHYDSCDANFKQCMGGQYLCLKTSEKLKRLEDNLLEHFSFFQKKMGLIVKTFGQATTFYSGLGSTAFNIAYGNPQPPHLKAIDSIQQEFNGQPFAWWVPLSQHDQKFTRDLLKAGFAATSTEHAMALELPSSPTLERATALGIQPVLDADGLEAFIKVIEAYDPSARKFYKYIQSKDLQSSERLFVGYIDEEPVTIGSLVLTDKTAGIYNLITKKPTQRQGYGSDMMRHLLHTATSMGCTLATLIASNDAGFRIYERSGFKKIGEIECLEFKH
jgi:ribosomal protein S18 acetylase RimI-like enzyme/predicted nucleotidyltransferase